MYYMTKYIEKIRSLQHFLDLGENFGGHFEKWPPQLT